MTELVRRPHLLSYLITVTVNGRQSWYGVSADSLSDALALLATSGFVLDTSDNGTTVEEGVSFRDFEDRPLLRNHLVPNMGPMQFRGVWYPNMNLRNK